VKRIYLSLILLALLFGVINYGFFKNLSRLPDPGYYWILLIINFDLLVLIVVFTISFRKLIKVYLKESKGKLRKKLSNILFLYLFIPLLLLNISSSIILVQATKTYASHRATSIYGLSEEARKEMEREILDQIKLYRNAILYMLSKGEELSRIKEILPGISDVKKVDACNFDVMYEGKKAIFCISHNGYYEISIDKNTKLQETINALVKLSSEFRSFVSSRDIIAGIYVFFMVLITLITALATVWISMLIARHISTPIEDLSRSATHIAQGRLETNVEVHTTGDEIEHLSRSFKKMRDNLKTIYEDLRRERDILERLIDSLPVGIVYTDGSDRIVRVNRAFKEMFGIKEDLTGKSIKSLENLPLSSDIRVEELDVSEGKIRIYEDVRPIIMAERFKTWQEAVKRIAHEIKNPLTPLRLSMERISRIILKDEYDPDKIKQLAERVIKEVDRIKILVDQFKHLTHYKEFKPESIELRSYLEEILGLYRSGGFNIEIEGDKKVSADRSLLKDMFFNIINNSIEWGATEAKIRITDNYIEYSDNGAGISEDKKDLIFIPYYSENPKGMGLGMAIVKKIAEDHGWKVEAIPSKDGFRLLIYFNQPLRASHTRDNQ